ncbi:MAG: alpha/beta hydrolase, partial [Ectothiorhodospiraceae bacterium]|nr:alpha/beta hydrolase [Ectothiorhodospiraceae bacterium]
ERDGGERPRATVVCMHGFLENPLYFTEHYADPDVQFLGICSADYHLPLDQPDMQPAPWASAPTAPLGSIEYDAAVLVQALEHLAKSPVIRVHGHSRGGAVTLEAAAMRPDLFQSVEVLLEAAVLPGGRPRQVMPAFVVWLLPFLIPLWRKQPINARNKAVWGPLDDPRKVRLIESYPFNPRRVSTIIANLRHMHRWMQRRGTAIYAQVDRGTALVPEKDRVLDPETMRASARQAGGRLRVVDLPGCSHFVVADQPQSLPPLRSEQS